MGWCWHRIWYSGRSELRCVIRGVMLLVILMSTPVNLLPPLLLSGFFSLKMAQSLAIAFIGKSMTSRMIFEQCACSPFLNPYQVSDVVRYTVYQVLMSPLSLSSPSEF